MNTKSLKLLRIGVLVLGWILLISALLGTWGRYNLYCQTLGNLEGSVTATAQFSILRALSSCFSDFGNVFFAFLMAAVLRMIEKESPVGRKNARRLMIVCCLSYMADAIVQFCSLILNLSGVTQIFNHPDWISLLPYVYVGATPIAPFLYAASIFILFTHFTKMVTFESEVA